MNKKMIIAAVILFFAMVSCMVITVNIYFPEKDVKEAYKALEKELMNPVGIKPQGTPEGTKPQQKPEVTKPPGSPQGSEPQVKPEEKPQSSLKFELGTIAYAQEPGLSGQIAEIVKKMPDVVNAYKEMGARIGDIDKMRDSGAVGEGNNGMLVVREEKMLTSGQKQLIEKENENRKTVISGMVRAIIRINRVPENEQNLNQVRPQAVEQFAAIRQDSAKKGWWIQSSDGNWTRK